VSAAVLAARCRELLGAEGTLDVLGPGAAHVAGSPVLAAAGPVVVSFLGTPADPSARQSLLDGVRRRLPAGTPLVLVDHNQPRGLALRALGAVLLRACGLGAARARYPAARELAALGFQVEHLRLACGERVQLVAARWPG
jgi:hypothetical protein